MFLLQLPISLTDKVESDGILDHVVPSVANFEGIKSSLGSSNEEPIVPELPTTLITEKNKNQSDISNFDQEKESLNEIIEETPMASLSSIVDIDDNPASAEEQVLSATRMTAKFITSDDSWNAGQRKVTSSESKRLSAIDQPAINESDPYKPSTKTIPAISEEKRSSDKDEKKLPQQIQAGDDDYPWYSSYYAIADADPKMSQLYENLTNTIKQLEKRPPPTTLKFHSTPYEPVTIHEYDRQALMDTKDIREKVHELAQLSSALRTTMGTSPDELDTNDDEFQVVQRRKRVSSLPVLDKTSTPTMNTIEALLSPDIDLKPLVIHGNPDAPGNVSPIPLVTAITGRTRKRKHKKRKKDKSEVLLFDAPMPSITDSTEGKPETLQSEVLHERMKTTQSSILPSFIDNESREMDQTLKQIEHEFQQSPLNELKRNLTDTTSEEQRDEPLSSSIVYDSIGLRQLDENNDSTSSDASQLLSSSFTTLPDETKFNIPKTEQATVTQTPATISSTDRKTIHPKTSLTSSSTKKKKIKQRLPDEEDLRQHDTLPSPMASKKSEVQSEPIPSMSTDNATSIIRTKVDTSPEDEEAEGVEDNEGFQVVRYRRHISSIARSEKTLPSSSTVTSKKRSDLDTDHKSTIILGFEDLSTPVVTPNNVAVTQSAATKRKQEKSKQDTFKFNAPLSSSSINADIISSASTDESRADHTKQQPTAQETILQSQIPSSTLPLVDESKAQSEPITRSPIKSEEKLFRSKAFTSPEQDEDDDGFQVVHHRKRISSAPRSEKSLPPLPTKPLNRQNLGPSIDLKPVIIHGRHGSGSRSMPRTTADGQISSRNRQQIRPNRGRQHTAPFSAPRPPVPRESHMMFSTHVENKTMEQMKQPVNGKSHRVNDTAIPSSLSSFLDQAWKEIKPLQPTITNIEQGSTPIERQTFIHVLQSKPSDQSQQQEKIETKIEQLSASIMFPADQSARQIAEEYHVPTTGKMKNVVSPTSTKEVIPSTIISAATAKTKKCTHTQEDDEDDGFRVVRYRKRGSTPTTMTTSFKQQSFGSDTDKESMNTFKKQSSTSSAIVPASPVLEVTTLKTKLNKNQEPNPTSDVSSPFDIFSSSITATDLVSSPKKELTNQTAIRHTELLLESQDSATSISSPHLDKSVAEITTTHKQFTTEADKPVLSKNLTKNIEEPSNGIQTKLKSIKLTTSPIVASAETRQDSLKKTKKKHKRSKRAPVQLETSTPSDEVSSALDNLSVEKIIPTTSLTLTPAPDILSTSNYIDDKSHVHKRKEETLSSQSKEPTMNIEGEQLKATSSKKSAKRRKKKAHGVENQSQEDVFNSSTTNNTTDKDSSSTALTTPVKHISHQSVTKDPLMSDNGKQESEWIIAQSRKKKIKINPTNSNNSIK